MEIKGRADLHCHTNHSGFTHFSAVPFPESITPPEAMVVAAAGKGLQVICITDHNTVRGAHIARKYAANSGLGIEVVVGEEISTSDGELLALFIEDMIPAGLTAAESIDMIKSQGGLAIAPHPFSYQCPSLGLMISELDLDGVEVLNAGHRDNYVNRIAGIRCNSGLARVASSDAHTPITLGNAYTFFDGDAPDDLYRAIRRGSTVPEGQSNRLADYIGWSVDMATGVSRKILTPSDLWQEDDPLGRINMMRPHNKLLALVGSALYVSTPLPLVAGCVGEGMVRYKGWKKWNQIMGHHTPARQSWMMNIWRHLSR